MRRYNISNVLYNLILVVILLLVFFSPIQLIAQENQTVTVAGRGTNCNEAEKDAYYKGLEQAGGAYYVSNKQMVNRQIVNESIEVLKTGNIIKAETLSACKKSADGAYEIIMKITVSQTELKKFVESKGKAVGISGQEMVRKKRIEEQAETNEFNIIKNILRQLENLASDPFDFFWEPGQTKFVLGSKVKMPGKVIVQYNQNYFNIGEKLIGELTDISLKPADIEFRKKYLNKEIISISINKKSYYLRNSLTKSKLLKFYQNLNAKSNDYIIVDGANKNLSLLNKTETLYKIADKGEMLFPESGVVLKEINGNITITESEAEKLNRINIFSEQRAKQITQNPTKAGDLSLYYYSETNPLEYAKLRNRIKESIEEITQERPEGSLNFEYKIEFTQTGNNKSGFLFKDDLESEFQFKLEDAVAEANISPSMIGDKYTKSNESLLVDFKWNRKKEKIKYTTDQQLLSNNFKSLDLPYGTYRTELKTKKLNGLTFYDQKISKYNPRGPWTAVNSILLPGWGARKVTYNEKNGWGRFAMVVVPLLTSFTFEMMSRSNYDKYRKADTSIEGNMASDYYSKASSQRKISLAFAGIGVAAYVFNITWVINHGIKNNKSREKVDELINREDGLYLRQQPLKF